MVHIPVRKVTELSLTGFDMVNPPSSIPFTVTVGSDWGHKIVRFEEYRPQGGGDCWSWEIVFEDGSSERFFQGSPGVCRVAYEPEEE